MTMEVTEGKATISFPNEVFYNPVQVFNRDLSVACLNVYSDTLFPLTVKCTKKRKTNDRQESKEETEEVCNKSTTVGIRLLEGLAASGLRSIRFALEVKGIESIIANDISSDAVKIMNNNIDKNKVENIVKSSQNDASLLMYQNRHPLSFRFDVVDLDPYGSPAEFLDGAVQCVNDGGLLAVTCTDMAVLCGNHSEACYAKYGSMPLKGKFCHEMALRIILSCIESHANHYKRYIVPLLSFSADFYIRVFVQVFTSALEVKRSASKKSLVYNCFGCGSYFFQPVGKRIEEGKTRKYPPGVGPPVGEKCPQCHQKFHLGGPIWSEAIHNANFVENVLKKVKESPDNYSSSHRMIGMLSVISEELENVPLYYNLDHLSSIVHSTTPSMIQMRSAIISLGYQVSGSHASKTAIKTDAPNNVIWDILRAWVQLHPLKKKHENTAGEVILSQPSSNIEVCFEYKSGANPLSRQLRLSRFPENPEAEWGPKARASKNRGGLSGKRKEHQGKRKGIKDEKYLKAFPCKRFKQGICKLADNCKYSHDIDNTRDMSHDMDKTRDNDMSRDNVEHKSEISRDSVESHDQSETAMDSKR